MLNESLTLQRSLIPLIIHHCIHHDDLEGSVLVKSEMKEEKSYLSNFCDSINPLLYDRTRRHP